MDPLVGEVLDGRFKVVEAIGKGGMGKVYRAVQTPLNRAVALKVLDANFGAGRDEAFRQRFLVEAALTAKLAHPNTITVIDYGCTSNGIYYIAMEYLDGRTLDETMRADGALPWRRVLQIGQQIARSLREAHNLGVVHRDLKPANVMLLHADDDTDHVKVLDFGLVKSFVQGQELEGRAITQQGMLMGSPPYMAPEQGEHNATDPRADIYALGIVLYEALTGAPPFLGQTPMEVILKHVHEKVPPLKTPAGMEEIPEEMKALVLKCLQKSPMDRFQSMEEVLQAMQELATPQAYITPQQVPVTDVTVLPSPGGKYRTAIFFGVATLAGALIATLLLKMFSGSHEPQPPSVVEVPLERPVKPAPPPPEKKAIAVEPPPPVKHPEEVVEVAPAKKMVTFHIKSEPEGATLTVGGKIIGTTPAWFELPEDKGGSTYVDLGFTLAGYQPTTIKLGGKGGTQVEFDQKMQAAQKQVKPPPPHHVPGKKAPASKLGDDEDDLKHPLP
ncbi:MAG: serine/threonine-protein kinase [Myxococcaceae bacterium]